MQTLFTKPSEKPLFMVQSKNQREIQTTNGVISGTLVEGLASKRANVFQG